MADNTLRLGGDQANAHRSGAKDFGELRSPGEGEMIMEQLPTHVATADEPIPDNGVHHGNGPDMRTAMPIEMMLAALHQAPDPASYLKLWHGMVKSAGGFVGLTITREGDEDLSIGAPCDAQLRHRWRWLHFLTEDLNRDLERKELLITSMIAAGRYADNRPADPRATVRAIRDYLRAEGRIMIDPEGNLTEGGGLPHQFAHGAGSAADECVRASRVYFAVRRRWRAERIIKRAVRMLGRPTANGWQVLEAQA